MRRFGWFSLFALTVVFVLSLSVVTADAGQLYMVYEDPNAAGNDELFLVDTDDASITSVGHHGGDTRLEGLALNDDGTKLYAVHNGDNTFFEDDLHSFMIDATGFTTIGDTPGDRGLAFNTVTGILYGSDGDYFVTIDTTNGIWTPLAAPPEDTEGLAADPVTNTIYGITDTVPGVLIAYDVGADTWSTVGPTGVGSGDDIGLAFDSNTSTLYAVNEYGILFSIDPINGNTTEIGDTGIYLGGESHMNVGLAFVPQDPIPEDPIPTLSEWGQILLVVMLCVSGFYVSRKRRLLS